MSVTLPLATKDVLEISCSISATDFQVVIHTVLCVLNIIFDVQIDSVSRRGLNLVDALDVQWVGERVIGRSDSSLEGRESSAAD